MLLLSAFLCGPIMPVGALARGLLFPRPARAAAALLLGAVARRLPGRARTTLRLRRRLGNRNLACRGRLSRNQRLRLVLFLDLQNRLGFVVSLARELAEKRGDVRASTVLAKWEQVLERSRLQKDDSFSPETLTEAERRWLQTNRSAEGRRWNLLTNMSAEQLASA
jgi:hypothetical protein